MLRWWIDWIHSIDPDPNNTNPIRIRLGTRKTNPSQEDTATKDETKTTPPADICFTVSSHFKWNAKIAWGLGNRLKTHHDYAENGNIWENRSIEIVSDTSDKMPSPKDAVVASLAETSPHPFSSMAMSPNRQYAVIAGKDTLNLLESMQMESKRCEKWRFRRWVDQQRTEHWNSMKTKS